MMINKEFALTGLGHWVGHCPTNGNVASLILSQGTCLGYGFDPQMRLLEEATDQCVLSGTDVPLPLSFPPFLSSNK